MEASSKSIDMIVHSPLIEHYLDNVAAFNPNDEFKPEGAILFQNGNKRLWLPTAFDENVPPGKVSLSSFQRDFLQIKPGSKIAIMVEVPSLSHEIGKVTLVCRRMFKGRERTLSEKFVRETLYKQYGERSILNRGHILPLVHNEKLFEIRAIELENHDGSALAFGIFSDKTSMTLQFPPDLRLLPPIFGT